MKVSESIAKGDSRSAMRHSAISATLLAAAGSAAAQPNPHPICTYDLTTVAGPLPAAVPSLGLLGLALLAAALGWLAWRQGRFPGARFMAVALLAGAALLANQGGGGLVQQAYAAAVNVVLSNPAGETVHVTSKWGDTVTLQNTSGAALRISSVTPDLPANSACSTGAVLPVGGSCSYTAQCMFVTACQGGADFNVDLWRCVCKPGLVYSFGTCVPPASCSGLVKPGIGEDICVPCTDINEDPNQTLGRCVCTSGYKRQTDGTCRQNCPVGQIVGVSADGGEDICKIP